MNSDIKQINKWMALGESMVNEVQEIWYQDLDDFQRFYLRRGSEYLMYDAEEEELVKIDNEFWNEIVMNAKKWKHQDPTKMTMDEIEELSY